MKVQMINKGDIKEQMTSRVNHIKRESIIQKYTPSN